MKNPKVIVEKIYDNRNDPTSPYKTLQLRTEIDKEGGNNVMAMFLKGGTPFIDKRVVFQSMHEDHIAEYGVKEGINLNDVLPTPVRLAISEIDEAEYQVLLKENPSLALGYKAKIYPASSEKAGQYFLDNTGAYIFRRVFVDEVNGVDSFVQHAASTTDAPTVNVENTQTEGLTV